LSQGEKDETVVDLKRGQQPQAQPLVDEAQKWQMEDEELIGSPDDSKRNTRNS